MSADRVPVAIVDLQDCDWKRSRIAVHVAGALDDQPAVLPDAVVVAVAGDVALVLVDVVDAAARLEAEVRVVRASDPRLAERVDARVAAQVAVEELVEVVVRARLGQRQRRELLGRAEPAADVVEAVAWSAGAASPSWSRSSRGQDRMLERHDRRRTRPRTAATSECALIATCQRAVPTPPAAGSGALRRGRAAGRAIVAFRTAGRSTRRCAATAAGRDRAPAASPRPARAHRDTWIPSARGAAATARVSGSTVRPRRSGAAYAKRHGARASRPPRRTAPAARGRASGRRARAGRSSSRRAPAPARTRPARCDGPTPLPVKPNA